MVHEERRRESSMTCELIIWVEACAGYSTDSSDFAYPWKAFCAL